MDWRCLSLPLGVMNYQHSGQNNAKSSCGVPLKGLDMRFGMIPEIFIWEVRRGLFLPICYQYYPCLGYQTCASKCSPPFPQLWSLGKKTINLSPTLGSVPICLCYRCQTSHRTALQGNSEKREKICSHGYGSVDKKFYSMSSLSLFSAVEAAGFSAKTRFRHMEFVLILNGFMRLHKSCCCTTVGFAFPACEAEHLMSVFGVMKTRRCVVKRS